MWLAISVLTGFVIGLVVAVVLIDWRLRRIENHIDRGTCAVAQSANNLDQVLRQFEAIARGQIVPDADEVGVDRACIH
jgi:hypothetical protein